MGLLLSDRKINDGTREGQKSQNLFNFVVKSEADVVGGYGRDRLSGLQKLRFVLFEGRDRYGEVRDRRVEERL